MKVFISWSGELSNKVALVFRDWLPSVIQAIEPYVSSEDTDKGARWSTDISKELESSRFGILCVTPENVGAPWLNFEAGALSKTIDKSRVCPFLFGLKRSEVRTGPLLQFQSTIYDRDDLQKLLHSLNNGGEPRCIDESRLDSIFEVWWPKLEQLLAPFLTDAGQPEKSKQAKEPGGQSEILEELLELARNQQKLLNSPETLMPPRYLEHVLRGIAAVGDISPMAFADLESGWRRLRDIATGLKEGEALPAAALNELIRELDKPIEHILEKAGPRAFPRRLRRVRDEP